ncbi:hypothetical protein LTR91_010223 [Friedmanniomyces endolithicus]|uniref:Protein PLANT CADMIUM RESISTANCE 3 n=1 Tax=Friedmanniomyces endolithicus TaxID=329885 RepID=A0AAN6QT75_9PEZI|nr:hypothetical protein LTR35_013053 [Friedmanniomyces endolithicus]KAK0283042.1 hypothetical protein LTS00_011867 [Friedmanniomyces endolithicus]KAK0318343.1 hypothetical protein LTR82_010731 [Friedmanniomyces endolithicus]KAK0927486.1 hypothetical protein LTR57_003207 [Friedmanniomyces endolithicus]KAK0986508.1 hypothetical protein LTR91_010223 [Friedmanniomyces endolithicus]
MDQHTHEEGWRNGICDHVCGGTFEVCITAWCCNCFMFGRVDQRLEKYPETNRDEFSLFSSGCFILGISNYCGLQWIPVWLKRKELRSRFGIQGNGCTDCLVSFCCHPCSIAQMETELKDRAATASTGMGEKQAPVGYAQQQDAMDYRPVA